MKMSLVIAPHRPLGDMADQGAAAHVEGGDFHAVAFGLRRIDQRAARIRDKIGFPIDKPADFLALVLGTK